MKLNEDKCHFMIFGERTNQEVSMNIGSCAVNNSKEEKLLGILIDANLSFEKHISNICQKAGKKLGFYHCHEYLSMSLTEYSTRIRINIALKNPNSDIGNSY